jgi:hypothetical protein
MGSEIDRNVYGWLVWDKRLTASSLTAQGATDTSSDYDQTTPRPGVPALTTGSNDAHIQIGGTQGDYIDVQVLQSGMPGRDGATIQYDVDGSGPWKGWDGYSYRYWEVINEYTGSGEERDRFGGTATVGGLPVVGYKTGALSWACEYWDQTNGWQAATGEDMAVGEGLDLVTLPSGRLLAIGYDAAALSVSGQVQYSDDGGATWADYSRDAFIDGDLPKTCRKLSAAYNGTEILIVLQSDDSSGDLYQLASDDLGATFNQVKVLTGFGKFISVVALPTGGFGLFCESASDDKPTFVRIGSAFSDISDATEVEITSYTGTLAMCGWATRDGILYCAFFDTNTADTLRVYRSVDFGENWDNTGDAVTLALLTLTGGSFSPALRNFDAIWSAYGCVLLHNFNDDLSTDYEDSLCAMWLGGWTTLELQYDQEFADLFTLPLDTLTKLGYGETGVGTTTLTDGRWELDGARKITGPVETASLSRVYFVDVEGVDSSRTADEYYIEAHFISGGIDYAIRIRMGGSNNGWTARDVNDNVLLHTSTAPATRWQFILGRTKMYARAVLAGGRGEWTEYTHSLGDDAAVAAGPYMTVDCTASHEGYIYALGSAGAIGNFLFTGDSEFQGRPASGVPVWAPGGSDAAAATIALVDGPATAGTEWAVEPAYDYGVDAAMPDTGPSPDRMWLSGVETEQVLCYDLGEETVLGRWVGLYAGRPRFRTAYLERYTGSSWTTVVTLDAAEGLTSLDFTREGDSLTPATTPAADADRYLQAGELAGGWVLVDSTNEAWLIRDNTAGSWGDVSATVRPVIYLEPGATGATSGTLSIIPPQALAVSSSGASLSPARYWRIRIPAQEAPVGGIGAGVLLAGRLEAVGAEPDWGWGDDTSLSVERAQSPYGTPHSAELGPPRRVWSWAWTEGSDLSQLRSTLDLDYLRPASGNQLVSAEDVWWQLHGLLVSTESGTLPCVAPAQRRL